MKAGFVGFCVVVAAIIFMAGCVENEPEMFDQVSFEKAIISDVEAKFPSADIIEIEGTSQVGGINVTSVRVTFNYTSICPVRMRVNYKYPSFGYETGVPLYLVKDCAYRCMGECVITGEEEAIVAAHSIPGTELVKEFVGNGEGVKAKAVLLKNDSIWRVSFLDEAGGLMLVNITSRNPEVRDIKIAGQAE